MIPISALVNKDHGTRDNDIPPDSSGELQKISQDLDETLGDDWEVKLLESVEGVTAPACRKMLHQIGINNHVVEPLALLDQACGPGITAGEVQRIVTADVLEKSNIVSADCSAQMVAACQKRASRLEWKGKCDARVLDAQQSHLPAESFSHVTMNLGFHVIPDAEAALKDCIRVLRPGGVLGFTTIHEYNPGFTPDLRSAFHSVGAPYPNPFPQQTHNQGRWYDLNWVRENLLQHGLEDVKVDVTSHTSTVDDAATFVSRFGQIIEYIRNAFWKDETRRKFEDKDRLKESLIQHLDEKYKGEGWKLTWTMIIASGRKKSA